MLMIAPLLVLALPLLDLHLVLLYFRLINLEVLHEAVHFLNRIIILWLLPVLSPLPSWLLLAAVD
jgi:hypothetical protein